MHLHQVENAYYIFTYAIYVHVDLYMSCWEWELSISKGWMSLTAGTVQQLDVG